MVYCFLVLYVVGLFWCSVELSFALSTFVVLGFVVLRYVALCFVLLDFGLLWDPNLG